MPISIKTKIVFHCKCVRCAYEWDADKKPHRCASCKYRSWNGEDHRLPDPYIGVPFPSQIEVGTEAPRPPSYESMLESFTKCKLVIDQVVVDNPCDHKHGQCVCGEIELVRDIDKQITRLKALRPLRSTYLVKKDEENEDDVAV